MKNRIRASCVRIYSLFTSSSSKIAWILKGYFSKIVETYSQPSQKPFTKYFDRYKISLIFGYIPELLFDDYKASYIRYRGDINTLFAKTLPSLEAIAPTSALSIFHRRVIKI